METGTGFIMDIIVLAIILLSTISGARKGFTLTVVSFMQWFVCVILGFIFCGQVRSLLADYTELDQIIHASVAEHMETTVSGSSTYSALPELFSGFIDETAENLSSGVASSLTAALLSVISFLLIVFGIKLAGFFLTGLFSRKYQSGITGFIDGFLGFLFGMARGLIIALLLFAVLVPIFGLLMPDSAGGIINAMNQSHIANVFYDSNVLLILVRDFFA